ncbi:type IV pilus modification PilV family protein [Naasia lichenicola]|uniref:type IV pilus modification PilV family protein n=1 Tax=Naasia lichenicola TaxID=2565933 RepID=UPI00130D9C23|nr:type II secretion system protein [Naasia lichenicola]
MRKHLKAAKADDSGFTLVEVIVSMMVFALIAVGVTYATSTALRLTNDTSAREVATNLAASEIDSVRTLDAFAVYTAPDRTVTVGTRVYTIKRSAGWVSATGTTSGCGTGTGQLQYKRVNVTVTWPSMLNSSAAARADTIIAPSSRLNDPDLGSIFISAIAADGTGSAGKSVSVSPTSGGGGAALPTQPAATDSDGCSYAFSVKPGSYTVTLSKAGAIDVNQATAPTATISVGAGGAASAAFQYDAAGTYNVSYAPNAAASRILPTNLSTTYVSSFAPYTSPTTGTPSTVSLFPFSDGYSAFGGAYIAPTTANTGCVSVDPAAWNQSTVNGKVMAAGDRLDPVSTTPGGSTAISVPMGALSYSGTLLVTNVRITSKVNAAAGDPGCYSNRQYTYSVSGLGGTSLLAVPYGSWLVEEQTILGWVTVANNRYTEPLNAAGDIETATNIVTIDPRKLK